MGECGVGSLAVSVSLGQDSMELKIIYTHPCVVDFSLCDDVISYESYELLKNRKAASEEEQLNLSFVEQGIIINSNHCYYYYHHIFLFFL